MLKVISSEIYLSVLKHSYIHLKSRSTKMNRLLSTAYSLPNPIDEKVKSWMRRYEDIFGITKLTEMHEKVLEVQLRMQDVQQKRRKLQEDIFNIQSKLQEVQSKLEKISRGDDMFLSIVTQEHELIKDQKKLQELLSVYNRTEREEQTALALAINNSQDHERTYREKNKYLSLITGVVGGLIGVIGSSINNWKHRKDIKYFAGDISRIIKEQHEASFEKEDLFFSNIMHTISALTENVKKLAPTITPYPDVEKQTNQLLNLMKMQDDALANVTQKINSFITSGKTTDYENSEQFFSDVMMKQVLDVVDNEIEHRIRKHTHATVGFLSTLLFLSTAIFLMLKTN